MNTLLYSLSCAVILLSAASCHRRALTYTSIESAVRSYEAQGFELIALDSAELNGDDRQDALLVIQDKVNRAEGARPLVLLKSHRKKYRLSFQNDSLIYDIESGPYSSVDCFVGISLDRDSIAIYYYGGMSTRWSEVQIFRYEEEAETFLLESQLVSVDNIYDDIEEAEVYESIFDLRPMAIDTIHMWDLE